MIFACRDTISSLRRLPRGIQVSIGAQLWGRSYILSKAFRLFKKITVSVKFYHTFAVARKRLFLNTGPAGNENETKTSFEKFPLVVQPHALLSIPKNIYFNTKICYFWKDIFFCKKCFVRTSCTRNALFRTENVYPATCSSQICSCRSKPYCLNLSSNRGTLLLAI